MIKRLIACLTICLIVTGLISPVFSDASALPQPNWSDPGISEIINISDLTGWMLNGGTYDVSTYTDAESFMNDYYTARTSTKLVDGVDLYYNQFGLGQTLFDIGNNSYNNRLDTNRMMSSSFREHSGYGRRFSEQANEALLDSGNLYDMKIPLLNEVEFANFVGYNHNALNIYSGFFTSGEAPTPSVPLEYADEIALLNDNQGQGVDFFFKNYTFNNSGYTFNTSDKSFFIPSYYIGTNSYWLVNAAWSTNEFYANNGIVTFNINSNQNNSYDLVLSGASPYMAWDGYIWAFTANQNGISGRTANSGSTIWSNGTILSNQSIQSILNYLIKNTRNVNIFVDGTPWAIVGIQSKITPEFPDAVGGEELPTTTWPISRPRVPYYTSVPGMLQAIEDAIQGDGKLDIDDLKPYLTDENGDPVPDPIFDPEPVPIPVPDPVNPDVVPGLPELPFIPLDMPGYNGVSVLAEIINFTNQSLPTSLIVTFWGIVFGIVILGLIKILHK